MNAIPLSGLLDRLRPHLYAALLCGFVGGAASAASMTFTDRATFEAALPSGAFTNDFSGVPDAFAAPVPEVSQSGGTPTVSYTLAAPAGLGVFPDAGFKAIGNWQSTEDITITFETGANFAGANVWLSDITGARLDGSITVDFSDGTSAAVPSTTSGDFGYIGVATGGPLLSTMTIRAVPGEFLNVSNLSAAVPEPSALLLAALGLALGKSRRR